MKFRRTTISLRLESSKCLKKDSWRDVSVRTKALMEQATWRAAVLSLQWHGMHTLIYTESNMLKQHGRNYSVEDWNVSILQTNSKYLQNLNHSRFAKANVCVAHTPTWVCDYLLTLDGTLFCLSLSLSLFSLSLSLLFVSVSHTHSHTYLIFGN